jgi:FG-GAP repeat
LCGAALIALFVTAPAAARAGAIVTGLGAGGVPQVGVVDSTNAQEFYSFLAYGSGFTGGVRVATGDVNGDGVPDIVTGSGQAPAPT